MLSALLVKLSWAMIPLFWPIWLVLCCACVWFAAKTHPQWRSGNRFDIPRSAVVGVALVLLPYVAFLIWGGDFTHHDNDVFTEHLVRGKRWPLGIWPWAGRYFPLFAQEFNVLGAVSSTPAFFHAAVSCQLAVLCVLIIAILDDLSPWLRALAVVTLIFVNSVGIVFADLIYTERNVVFWLAVLILAAKRHDRAPSRLNLAASLIAAHITLYYKDSAFLLVGTFVAVRLIIAWRRDRSTSWRWIRGQPLELGLVALCAACVGQISLCLLSSSSSRYVQQINVGRAQAVVDYLRSDPLLFALAGGLAMRARALRSVVQLDPLWDALAVSALVYVSALMAIGMSCDRYVAPVDMIALLYATRQLSRWHTDSRFGLWMPRAAGVACALASVLFGATRIVEYKSIMRGTTELATFLESYADAHVGPLTLYFPVSPGWRMVNFQVYLRYRNEALYGRTRFTAPRDFENGQCVGYLPYKCQTSAAALPGDLVIQLPDDTSRDSEPGAQMLYEYSLWPGGMPSVAGLFLHREQPLFAGRYMPSGWLNASASRRGDAPSTDASEGYGHAAR